MFASVLWRFLSSSSILTEVSSALATCHTQFKCAIVREWINDYWLAITHRLALECLDCLHMLAHVVSHWLEVTQDTLSLVDNSLVLKNGAVVGKVNGRRLGRVLAVNALSLSMALAESLKRCNSFCKQPAGAC